MDQTVDPAENSEGQGVPRRGVGGAAHGDTGVHTRTRADTYIGKHALTAETQAGPLAEGLLAGRP